MVPQGIKDLADSLHLYMFLLKKCYVKDVHNILKMYNAEFIHLTDIIKGV